MTGAAVEVSEIIGQLDREIDLLKQARAILQRRVAVSLRRNTAGKRRLTPEGRRRISEAVKRRWVAERKTKSSMR
jgi:hypothetical protein